jgi:hypothetical protein
MKAFTVDFLHPVRSLKLSCVIQHPARKSWQMRKFEFFDFKNNTSSFELCTAAFPDSEEKQIKIPHD